MLKTDYLVIGSGIAGLTFAIKAQEHGKVTIVTKRKLTDSATSFAQGGIAAVTDPEDSLELHLKDTINCGAGLTNEVAAGKIIAEGPERIRDLVDVGVKFDLRKSDDGEDESFRLGLEGGHSRRRILHVADKTGLAIEQALAKRVASLTKSGRITILENYIALDLITSKKLNLSPAHHGDVCLGAYILDIAQGQILSLSAKATIIASGGAGKVYIYTTNPDVSTGDGMAMAYRAGAAIANMEFVQFHPTCLFHPEAKYFLITEAVRGEGGILKLADGAEFMHKYHPQKELAPRDIVARAIDSELKERGEKCVYLDIKHRGEEFIKQRFPTVHTTCLKYGLDITKVSIPVVPAAHYFCGGVVTDENGATDIPGLYTIGEAACTGLHGANRLASNSLLEALVMAHRTAKAVKTQTVTAPVKISIPDWNPGRARNSDEQVVIEQNWEEIRRFMWNYVGLVRTDKRLARAQARIELLQEEIEQYYWDFTVTSDLIELRNLAMVAELVIRSAMSRKESRGLHYNMDYPDSDNENFKQNTVLRRSPTGQPELKSSLSSLSSLSFKGKTSATQQTQQTQ